MYMVQKLELFPTSYEYSIGKYNNLKEMFVRGDVDISGNIAMSGNINCNEINSTSITATTFYGDGSQLTGIITSGGSANLNEYSDASFGNVDVSGNININGKATITINDVANQNTTLLELKTDTNTPRIRHDFWQTSNNYGDYQIYPASAGTTDFKIGGYSSTFQTIRLNALNGVEVYSNQSTNTHGNIKCNTLELTNKIKGPSDLVIDPSPHDSSGGNVTVMGNLKVDGLLDMSNNIIMNNNRIIFSASDSSIIPPDTGIITRVQDISNSLTNVISDVSNLLISNNDASFNNVDISGNLTLKGSLGVLDTSINDISYGNVGAVLTSNGFGNPLSWREPVYYSAHLTNDITYNSTIYAVPQNVVNLTLDTESHLNSFNTATGIFTAPRDGIYYVDYGVLASDDADPKEMYVLVSRIDFRTSNSGTFTQHTGNHVLGGNLSIIQSNVSSLMQLSKGNQIRCVFQMTFNTGSNSAYRTKLLANYYHPTQSDRHSLRGTRQTVFSIC